jgi:hypothetical protein
MKAFSLSDSQDEVAGTRREFRKWGKILRGDSYSLEERRR